MKKLILIAFASVAMSSSAMAQLFAPSKQTATVDDNGATIALLGLAIVGLVALRRRFSK